MNTMGLVRNFTTFLSSIRFIAKGRNISLFILLICDENKNVWNKLMIESFQVFVKQNRRNRYFEDQFKLGSFLNVNFYLVQSKSFHLWEVWEVSLISDHKFLFSLMKTSKISFLEKFHTLTHIQLTCQFYGTASCVKFKFQNSIECIKVKMNLFESVRTTCSTRKINFNEINFDRFNFSAHFLWIIETLSRWSVKFSVTSRLSWIYHILKLPIEDFLKGNLKFINSWPFRLWNSN